MYYVYICIRIIYIYMYNPSDTRVSPLVAYNPTVRRRCCRWLRASPRDPVLTHVHTYTRCRRKGTRPGLVVLAPRRIHPDRTRPRSHNPSLFTPWIRSFTSRDNLLSSSFPSGGAALRLTFSLPLSLALLLCRACARVCIYRAHHFSAAVTPGEHVCT